MRDTAGALRRNEFRTLAHHVPDFLQLHNPRVPKCALASARILSAAPAERSESVPHRQGHLAVVVRAGHFNIRNFSLLSGEWRGSRPCICYGHELVGITVHQQQRQRVPHWFENGGREDVRRAGSDRAATAAHVDTCFPERELPRRPWSGRADRRGSRRR
jgi:hypothetical protein